MDSREPHDPRLGLYRFSYRVAERTIDGQAETYRDQRQEGHTLARFAIFFGAAQLATMAFLVQHGAFFDLIGSFTILAAFGLNALALVQFIYAGRFSTRRPVARGPDLGAVYAYIDEPDRDEMSFIGSLLRTYARIAGSNLENIVRLQRGHGRGILLLLAALMVGVSGVVYLWRATIPWIRGPWLPKRTVRPRFQNRGIQGSSTSGRRRYQWVRPRFGIRSSRGGMGSGRSCAGSGLESSRRCHPWSKRVTTLVIPSGIGMDSNT